MQRRLTANWQHHLLSAVLKGQFMISPDLAKGMGAQVSKLLDQSAIFQNDLQKLESIDITAYNDDDDNEHEAADIEETGNQQPHVVVLPVKGTMMKYGTWCSYGMQEIAHYIKHFAAMEHVQGIVLDIDSGGGAVNAVPPLLEAIEFVQKLGKPIVAHADCACSAAYWTAAATDQIFANNTLVSTFGSIGVMLSFMDMIPYYEEQGAKFHEVYADQSGDKNLAFQELLKGEYDKIRQEQLNPMAIEFQNAVKAKRGDKLKAEHPGLLTGATFTGSTAIELGLADQVGSLLDAVKYVQLQSWSNQ